MNPIYALRLQLNMTQEEVANTLGITEQTVRRAEHGTFAHPPKSLTEWYAQHRNKDLWSDYNEWRRNHRARIREFVPQTDPRNYGLSEHPFVLFRDELMEYYLSQPKPEKGLSVTNSVSGFCKVTAVEPKQVDAFEAGFSKSIPSELHMMLIEIDYRYIGEMEQVLRDRHQQFLSGVK